jgi:hypothetical protein
MADDIDRNKLGALLRQQRDRLSELEKQVKDTAKAQSYLSFKEKTLRDALKVTPNWYGWEINFAQFATQRTPVTIQTDPRGYFFAERMWMSWRVTGGGGTSQGKWQSISSDNPAIVAATMWAAAPLPVPAAGIDFYWEYSEGSASLMRMNIAVPGSVLYRGDMDGCIPGSDGWQPSTTVTFFITPIGTNGTPFAGIFNICVAGSQAYQTLL